ncbi:MAG: hypothetical protein KA436_11680 [Oligoflexales bacterium]|nr:hypothetical protein [Oligoflexales bacterium]
MGAASLIWNKYIVLIPDKFAISVKVFKVPPDDAKHPEGVKTSFVLLDLELGAAALLIDNHAPFGFHMHTGLPGNKELRQELNVKTYQAVYEVFMVEVHKRVEDYKSKI